MKRCEFYIWPGIFWRWFISKDPGTADWLAQKFLGAEKNLCYVSPFLINAIIRAYITELEGGEASGYIPSLVISCNSFVNPRPREITKLPLPVDCGGAVRDYSNSLSSPAYCFDFVSTELPVKQQLPFA